MPIRSPMAACEMPPLTFSTYSHQLTPQLYALTTYAYTHEILFYALTPMRIRVSLNRVRIIAC